MQYNRVLARAGFTLIELLVVVLIIGILAAIALPQYQRSVTKAKLSTGLQMMRSLSHGVEEYILSQGRAPDSLSYLTVSPPLDCRADGRCYDKYFGYLMQNTNRLQAWNDDGSYGFIWNSSMQPQGTPNTFVCFVLIGSKADKDKYCELIGGHDRIISPTASTYYWWYL